MDFFVMFLILEGLSIALLIGAVILYYKRSAIKTALAKRKIQTFPPDSLVLKSAAIEKFLSSSERTGDREWEEAREFIRAVVKLTDDSHWTINSYRALFQSVNRTGGEIQSIRAYVRLYVQDTMIHTFEIARTNIANNGKIKAYERIQSKTRDVIGVFRVQFGSFFPGRIGIVYSAEFYDYEVSLSANHKMATNNYIRDIAKLDRIERKLTPAEEFAKAAEDLPDDLRKKADRISKTLASMPEIGQEKKRSREKAESFEGKYLPVVTRAIWNYTRDPDEQKHGELDHTLDVVAKATENLFARISSNEQMTSSMEQDILEQQLIREGLYSPFDDPAGEKKMGN